MPVIQRRILALSYKGARVLGAVKSQGRTVIAFQNDTPKDLVEGLTRIDTGRGTLFYAPEDTIEDAQLPELELFENRKVLLAFRNAETPQATADWVRYHAQEFGCSDVVIFNRAKPGSDDFVLSLNRQLEGEGTQVLVVEADTALGRKDAPDARDPAMAPAMHADLTDVAKNPWHAPLAEMTVYELIRRRFLASARSVALLDISDHLLPTSPSAFELAECNPGCAISLSGSEVYPWRLRQKQPAPFMDHIAKRRGERRRLISWCAAPAALPDTCVWQPGRPSGVAAIDETVPFVRAIGLVFPGAPVDSLVKKADLTEDATLVAGFEKRGHKPIRLPASSPIPARPKKGIITIVSAMKNEGPFVLDWIAHNRAIGVERFLIYTNECGDGTDHLLELLGDAGVMHRDNPYRKTGNVPQYAAFSAAEKEQTVISSDWLLTLDVDEYVNIHTGDGRLQDLLESVPNAHVISMPWRLFGNADRHDFVDRPVTEQFTQAAPAFMPRPYQAWAFKTLYRNAGLFKRLGVHRPKGVQGRTHDGISWVNGSGKEMPPEVWSKAWRVGTANWGYDLVSLNHYAVRSAESFLIKRDRGRVNHVHEDQDDAYWFRMNHNFEEETSILKLALRVAKEKAALLALPGVAEAHETAVHWHQKRITELKAQPEMQAFYERITSSRMEKLSRLGPHFGMTVFMEGPQVVPDKVLDREPGSRFHFTLNRPKPTK